MPKIIPTEYDETVQEICDLYNEAEADLKTYGRQSNTLLVAGVNQLRYSGQHMVRALSATDDATIEAELESSKRHAQRAVYDINDAAVQFFLYEIRRIRTSYSVNFNSVVPNYGEILNAVHEVERRIEDKSLEHKDHRELLYREIREEVRLLGRAHDQMVMAVPDIVNEVNRQMRARNRMWLTIAIAVIGALIGIARLVVVI